MSRILILEDEAGFQTLMTEILTQAGHQVVSTAAGQDALGLIGAQPVDLIFIDNRMPGMTGLEFLQNLRQMGHETPVIMMTAYADVPVVVQAMRLGAVDFLVKPFRIEAVLPLVERHLQTALPPGPG